MKKVNVQFVTVPPAIAKIDLVSGIRTKEEAERWGGKHGYPTVYWLKSRQRAYAEKMQRHLPQSVTKETKGLFAPSEQGGSLLENAILAGLVVLILYWLGKFLGVPW